MQKRKKTLLIILSQILVRLVCDSIIMKLPCSVCRPAADLMMFTSEWISDVIELLKK